MKILWFTWKDITHPLAGGAELVNDQLARRLVADGHKVILVTGGYTGCEPRATVNGYKVVRLGSRYSLYVLAARYYRQHLRGWADLVVEEVNTLPFFTRFYVKEPTVLLFHQLARQIWFYQMPPGISLAGFLAEPLYLRLLGGGTPVITVSDSTKQDLQRHGFKNIAIISEGIKMQPLARLADDKYDQPTMLSFGTLRSMKRTLHHVEAFNRAKQSMPDLRLIVAGDSSDPYAAKVLQAIARSPYASDITHINRPSDEEKVDLFRRSHVFVVTSVKEGWGIVVTEAASQGTPAVVYDVDGLRDSVRDGETGVITDVSPTALADGIVDLLQDQPRYKQIRKAAWEWSRTITFDRSYQDFQAALSQFALAAQPNLIDQPEGEL